MTFITVVRNNTFPAGSVEVELTGLFTGNLSGNVLNAIIVQSTTGQFDTIEATTTNGNVTFSDNVVIDSANSLSVDTINDISGSGITVEGVTINNGEFISNVCVNASNFVQTDNIEAKGTTITIHDPIVIASSADQIRFTDGIEIGNPTTNATNSDAVAIGKFATAANYSVAIGTSTANGSYAISIGYAATASGYKSVSFGGDSTASGNCSVALGNNANATAANVIAIGCNQTSSVADSIALGTPNPTGTPTAEAWGQIFQNKSWADSTFDLAFINETGDIVKGSSGLTGNVDFNCQDLANIANIEIEGLSAKTGTTITVEAGTTLNVDTIGETTAAAGVTIDGVLLQDNDVEADEVRTDTLSVKAGSQITVTEDLVPSTTGTFTLGTASFRWNEIYGNSMNLSGDATILGNLTVSGNTTTIDTENITVQDNKIVLNNGETGAGVTAGSAGLEIDRGTEQNFFLCFDETRDALVSGLSNVTSELDQVAHRVDSVTANGIAFFNPSGLLATDAGFTYNAAADIFTTATVCATTAIETDTLSDKTAGFITVTDPIVMSSAGDQIRFTSGIEIGSSGTNTTDNDAIAIGKSATATNSYAIAIGTSSGASAGYSAAIGYNTTASGDRSTALGYSATASDDETLAIGYSSTASGYRSTAIGTSTDAISSYGVAVGFAADAQTESGIAIGSHSEASGGIGAIGIGGGDSANGEGTSTGAKATALDAIAIGRDSAASGNCSIAIGGNASATAANVISIGCDTASSTADSINLGSTSPTGTPTAEAWGQIFSNRGWVGGGVTPASIDDDGNIIRGNADATVSNLICATIAVQTPLLEGKNAGEITVSDDLAMDAANVFKSDTIESTSGGAITFNDTICITSPGELQTDTISEKTGGTGVTIDGVLMMDNNVTADVVNANTVNTTDLNTDTVNPNSGTDVTFTGTTNTFNATTNNVNGTSTTFSGNVTINGFLDACDIKYCYEEINASTRTLVEADDILGGNTQANAIVFTLPEISTLSGSGYKKFTIVDIGGNASSNNITIVTSGSDTLLGGNTMVLSGDYNSFQVFSDGTSKWFFA